MFKNMEEEYYFNNYLLNASHNVPVGAPTEEEIRNSFYKLVDGMKLLYPVDKDEDYTEFYYILENKIKIFCTVLNVTDGGFISVKFDTMNGEIVYSFFDEHIRDVIIKIIVMLKNFNIMFLDQKYNALV